LFCSLSLPPPLSLSLSLSLPHTSLSLSLSNPSLSLPPFSLSPPTLLSLSSPLPVPVLLMRLLFWNFLSLSDDTHRFLPPIWTSVSLSVCVCVCVRSTTDKKKLTQKCYPPLSSVLYETPLKVSFSPSKSKKNTSFSSSPL